MMQAKKTLAFLAFLVLTVAIAAGATYFFLRSLPPRICQEATTGLYTPHLWVHELSLTRSQKKKLEPLEAELSRNLESIQLESAGKRITLCRLLKNESIRKKDMDRYAKQLAAVEVEKKKLIIGHLIAIRDILTPEQKNKFFNAVMHDICSTCRSTKHSECLCGQCGL